MDDFRRFTVLGAGAWGTALASVMARRGARVMLWARDPRLSATINATHRNPDYLPDISLPEGLRGTSDPAACVECDALFLVVPAQALGTILAAFAAELKAGLPVVICAKGIERRTLQLLSARVESLAPSAQVMVLSGPSFAADVARQLPTAVTLAGHDKVLARALAIAISGDNFRPYVSDDVIGAQIGGAVKNVLAIACGIADGRALGASAAAALIARGFAELSRFGIAMGAQPETLAGLSGLGDLVLTCSSRQSRNMSLGYRLGQGESLEEILQSRRAVSEGVHSAAAIVDKAEQLGVTMPICAAVHAVIEHGRVIDDVIDQLLSRPLRDERE